MNYFNYYSYPIVVGTVLIIIAIFLFRDGVKRTDWIALGAVVVGFGLGWYNFRPVHSPLTAPQIEALLQEGKPVLIELESQY